MTQNRATGEIGGEWPRLLWRVVFGKVRLLYKIGVRSTKTQEETQETKSKNNQCSTLNIQGPEHIIWILVLGSLFLSLLLTTVSLIFVLGSLSLQSWV
jgi:hypothetical protein